jgi:hypothetical protein
MATSKSSEKCTATLAIYSGRRDPSWSLSRSFLLRLEEIWQNLSSFAGPLPVAPPLGYRGCSVNCGQRRGWFGFGGVVERGKEHRADPERLFERTVLESAPKGAIPIEVIRMIR